MFRHRARVVEALLLLAICALMKRLLPFHVLIRLAGGVTASLSPEIRETASGQPDARAIGHAVARATCRLPWPANCLSQALAGAVMLRRRRFAYRLDIGVAKDADGLSAHAWLWAGGMIICGGRAISEFTPLASFSATPPPSPPVSP